MKLTALIRTLFLGAALTTGSLFANTLYIYNTDNDGVPTLPGGEFGVAFSPLGNFYTFCIEYTVHVALPGTYDYTISTKAENQADTLSVGSAWLYEQFFLGTLSGPTPASSYFDSHDANAGLLQQAFWALEDEAGGAETYYYDLAVTHFGSAALAKADITASSKVQVLNLWEVGTGADVQSQLVYVPDTGMTIALLGIGLLSLAGFRRKL